ncbi:methyltransferase domain-containing protein [Acetobacter lambici]|uniref:Class I SAM-dependent methyltransferase n=1 Tax=Acetobacter lambici TaxID=1332824 RepID=A0ABT1EWT1_9PROT|nr:methyltransferase domain-containing protein [Acetobacter lambici]MCP1241975.1 class I SAM-dependent methyltransferase [Acetobacter lambici]MCP1257407.1 class I SAM-dependent methyltransferase [Acetobacter lambici]NHO56452.1 methyltransferase domain-containing protein [Acetobacter lambici]
MQNATSREESFYGTPSGKVYVSLLGERMRWFWPEMKNQSVLGLGGAAPYLHTIGDSSTLRIGAYLGNTRVDTAFQPGQCCVVDPAELPFEPQKFDRILLVHALQGRDNPLTVLRSAARALKDDGRLLMVVPSRLGGRARLRRTPFARDASFTRPKLRQLLAAAMLRAEQWDEAVFLPASQACRTLRRGRRMDIAGKVLCPGGGSLILVEAVPDMYSALPLSLHHKKGWFARMRLTSAGMAGAPRAGKLP